MKLKATWRPLAAAGLLLAAAVALVILAVALMGLNVGVAEAMPTAAPAGQLGQTTYTETITITPAAGNLGPGYRWDRPKGIEQGASSAVGLTPSADHHSFGIMRATWQAGNLSLYVHNVTVSAVSAPQEGGSNVKYSCAPSGDLDVCAMPNPFGAGPVALTLEYFLDGGLPNGALAQTTVTIIAILDAGSSGPRIGFDSGSQPFGSLNPTSWTIGTQTKTVTTLQHYGAGNNPGLDLFINTSNVTVNSMRSDGTLICSTWTILSTWFYCSRSTSPWISGDTGYSISTSLTDDSSVIAPSAPTGLSATGGDRRVTLSWTNPSNPTITSYQYRQASSSSGLSSATWVTINNSGANTTSLILTGLNQGTTYWFDLRAVNSVGNSPDSANVSGTTSGPPPTPTPTPVPPPPTPTPTPVPSLTTGCADKAVQEFRMRRLAASVRLDWRRYTDCNGGYLMEREEYVAGEEGSGFSNRALVPASGTISASLSTFTDGDIIPGRAYRYRIRGRTSNQEGPWSDWLVSRPFNPGLGDGPENLRVETAPPCGEDLGRCSLWLRWDAEDTATSYEVETIAVNAVEYGRQPYPLTPVSRPEYFFEAHGSASFRVRSLLTGREDCTTGNPCYSRWTGWVNYGFVPEAAAVPLPDPLARRPTPDPQTQEVREALEEAIAAASEPSGIEADAGSLINWVITLAALGGLGIAAAVGMAVGLGGFGVAIGVAFALIVLWPSVELFGLPWQWATACTVVTLMLGGIAGARMWLRR